MTFLKGLGACLDALDGLLWHIRIAALRSQEPGTQSMKWL